MNNTSAAYFFYGQNRNKWRNQTNNIAKEFIISKAVNPASKTSLLPITSI